MLIKRFTSFKCASVFKFPRCFSHDTDQRLFLNHVATARPEFTLQREGRMESTAAFLLLWYMLTQHFELPPFFLFFFQKCIFLTEDLGQLPNVCHPLSYWFHKKATVCQDQKRQRRTRKVYFPRPHLLNHHTDNKSSCSACCCSLTQT